MKKLTTKEWIEKAQKVHGKTYNYSKSQYINTRSKIEIICPEHGEFWQEANAHIQGQGCPKCANLSRNKFKFNTQEEFIIKANIIHNFKYNYSKIIYKLSKEKVIIICPIHGEFFQTPNDHLQNKGCPKCQLKSQTKLYNLLSNTFLNEIIYFEFGELIWLNGQRFDIYFPKYNIAIEYNGIQHYIPQKHFGGEIKFIETCNRDNLKRQKCIDNNCYLFEIKYDYDENEYVQLTKNITSIINKLKNKTNEN